MGLASGVCGYEHGEAYRAGGLQVYESDPCRLDELFRTRREALDPLQGLLPVARRALAQQEVMKRLGRAGETEQVLGEKEHEDLEEAPFP